MFKYQEIQVTAIIFDEDSYISQIAGHCKRQFVN